MRNLPLATLRAFEAAARHESFIKAAAELNLTDSAISHQLKRLETALGFDLFEKAGRGVALTDAGRVFARSVREALGDIGATADMLADANSVGGALVIACPPMFASKWLAKSFADFQRNHPGIECHIRLVDNDRVGTSQDYDVGIQFGSGGWAGKWTAVLRDVTLTPACSPRIYQGTGELLREPRDLERTVLLHRDDGTEWRRWLASVGIHFSSGRQANLYCSDLSIAIDLAVEGVGVALVSEVLSLGNIYQGTLIRPFPHTIEADGGWYVLCDRHRLDRPSVRAFIRWLMGRFGHAFDVAHPEAEPGSQMHANGVLERGIREAALTAAASGHRAG